MGFKNDIFYFKILNIVSMLLRYNGNQVAIYLTGNIVNIITVVIENSFKISQF